MVTLPSRNEYIANYSQHDCQNDSSSIREHLSIQIKTDQLSTTNLQQIPLNFCESEAVLVFLSSDIQIEMYTDLQSN